MSPSPNNRKQRHEAHQRRVPRVLLLVSRFSQPPNHPPPRLRTFHPVDWFRLLVWLLLRPERYTQHHKRYGDSALRGTGAFLVSTLIWLPLALAMLTIMLFPDHILRDIVFDPITPVMRLIMVLIFWLMTAYIEYRVYPDSIITSVAAMLVLNIALILSGGYVGGRTVLLTVLPSVGVAIGIMSALAGGVWGLVGVGVAIVLAYFMAGTLYGSLATLLVIFCAGVLDGIGQRQQATLITRALFWGMGLGYGAMLWALWF